jgi:protein-tyrosine-phosphatase
MTVQKSILFVCLGNICRSPACEGICKSIVNNSIAVDSAGTSSEHSGGSPDSRSVSVCRKHGISISDQRARKLTKADFSKFTVIAALDPYIFADCKRVQPPGSTAKLVLFNAPKGIDDPYYGGTDGFEVMFGNITSAMRPFLTENGLL